MPTRAIEVRIWNQTVGAVAETAAGQRAFAFEYDPAWVAQGIELAPLMMPASDTIYTFPDLSPETFRHLPGLLADALPDRWGNALLTAHLASQGRTASDISTLDRLAYLTPSPS